MIRTRSLRAAAAGLLVACTAGATAATAHASVPAQSGSSGINITGSSTVEPITSLVAELFSEDNPAVAIRVDGPGTGDGAELFCSAEPGQWDATDASRPLQDSEKADCAANNVEFTELLVGIDGLTIVAHPDSKLKCVDPQQIYAIFGPESGGGTTDLADAQAIAADLGSSNKALPKGSVRKFTPGPESGTYDSFIELNYEDLMEERLEAGDIPSSRVGTNDDGDPAVTEPLVAAGTFPNDNEIVKRVEASEEGIGFFGFAYFQENEGNLKALKVYNEDLGKCVKPTAKTIQSGDYPISRPLFIYIDNAKLASNGSFKRYMDSYMTQDTLTDTVTDAGYVPADASTISSTIAAYKAAVAG